MLLIISGQYVESELAAEFGKIPPTFLPLGNNRLFTHQIAQLGHHYDRISLTVPSDFEVDETDELALAELDVTIFRTAVGISLGSAVRESLGRVSVTGRIDILYGDTLVFADDVGGTDWIGVSGSDNFYPWHYESLSEANGERGWVDAADADVSTLEDQAWAGMFSFASASALQAKLENECDFIAAVTLYGREHAPLERRSLKRWLDFGHVHTYFHSRLAVTTQRHFNELTIADGVLTKSSADSAKMAAEARWFKSAPPTVRPYLPNFISSSSPASTPASYSIEYLPLTSLNELYVFGRLPTKVWKKILAACDRYFCAERMVPLAEDLPSNFGQRLYHDKTLARLQTFSLQSKIDIERPWNYAGASLPSLAGMAEIAAAAVTTQPVCPSFIHGDFCFSNILYDFRSDRIKVIDPRGLDVENRMTAFGDFRYEVGKLAHSVLGLYDVILADRFSLTISGHDINFKILHERSHAIRELFSVTKFAGHTPSEWQCQPVMVLLFLSMLSLHADKPQRQRALMANCMRIFQEWKP